MFFRFGFIDQAQYLQGDQRHQCDHRDHAEAVDQRRRLARSRGDALAEGQHEGRGQRAASDAARVEGNADEDLGGKDAEGEGDDVSRQEEMPDFHTRIGDTDHGEADGDAVAEGEGDQYDESLDRSARDVLDLTRQDVYGRFGEDHQHAEDETDDEDGEIRHAEIEVRADLPADRHEATVHSGHEDRQPDEGVNQPFCDEQVGFAVELDLKELRGDEHDDDRYHRDCNVFKLREQDGEKGNILVRDYSAAVKVMGVDEQAQNQSRDDRAGGGDSQQTETVFLRRTLFRFDHGDADGKGKQERNGKATGRRAGRVKGDREKLVGNKE